MCVCVYFRGRINYTEMYDMLRNMEPPVGFGKKCPYRLAYRVSNTGLRHKRISIERSITVLICHAHGLRLTLVSMFIKGTYLQC